ncbi:MULTISPECIES: Lrp/AsnC ligand binding domain-containing protein [Glycocaulis]|jgi:DNA-binding Lrp family transcriptional regulator|uniref:AsnC family transcriptional regulator n=2 Tax=Glycocaulis TaxID=1433402 RepID=A0ABQ1XFT9_9PROT|nr:Lrp/AsnC ligand binding domain-containing protein [Glycocaulis albus]MBV5261280.1 Lrp/AsnC family transcriptional regulator [Synechococcus moorigangaii CMS01]GGG93232.1 AsnC family transcriptional regulator [Glycocaulis albus]HCY54579.1 AsnC family transcriptional regulator [Oceanicaulis sp.]
MRQFYIFIKCELGKTYDVASALVDTLEETRQVHSVSGAFDLLAQFAVESEADIGRFVNQKVQTISGVKDTQTIICFNAFTRDRGLGD